MEFVFSINGVKRVLREIELVSILEKHFSNEVVSIPKGPIWGEFFWVNPLLINRQPFYIERSDYKEEMLRAHITEAFNEWDNLIAGDSNCLKEFRTIVPYANNVLWNVTEWNDVAHNMSGKIATKMEQALLWAQRIDNGENWQEVLNSLYTGGVGKRLLKDYNGEYRIYDSIYDSSYMIPDQSLTTAIPLIVTK